MSSNELIAVFAPIHQCKSGPFLAYQYLRGKVELPFRREVFNQIVSIIQLSFSYYCIPMNYMFGNEGKLEISLPSLYPLLTKLQKIDDNLI